MATTVSSSSSTTSAHQFKGGGEGEGHAAEQGNYNMRFLQYRSSQNSSRVGANYQVVVPLVLPTEKQEEIKRLRRGVARPDETRRTPELTALAAELGDRVVKSSCPGPFLQVDVDTVMTALEARGGPEPARVPSEGRDWYEESMLVSTALGGRTLRRNQWQVAEVRSLGRTLERLEKWNEEVETVLEQDRRITMQEATALWSEGRILERVYDGLHPQVAALHRIMGPTEAFEARVAQGRWREEERDQLVREGEALEVIPASALRRLSISKSAAVEEGELGDPTSSNDPELLEWVRKARGKIESGKRSRIPLHTVEELLEDFKSRALEADTAEAHRLLVALEEGKEAATMWRERASRALAVDEGGGLGSGGVLSLEGLRELWDEHAQLPRVCVPEVCRRLESLIKRGEAWEERCRGLLEGGSSPRAVVEGRVVLEEIAQSGITKAVDLSECLRNLKVAVEVAEEWERKAEAAVKNWEVGYTRKICSGCDRLSIDEQGPRTGLGEGPAGIGSAFMENLVEEIRWEVALYEREIGENLDFLPSCGIFVKLRKSGEELKFRDEVLYGKICRVAAEVDTWERRKRSLIEDLAVFPRPAGGLRALSFLFMDYMRTGICGTKAEQEDLEGLLATMKEEVWGWDVRKAVAAVPLSSSSLERLSESYPKSLKILQRTEGCGRVSLADLPLLGAADFEHTLVEIEKVCTFLMESLPIWEEEWQVTSSVIGNGEKKLEESPNPSLAEAVVEYTPYRVRDSTVEGEWDFISTLADVEAACRSLLEISQPIDISGWQHLSRVLREIDSNLVQVPELLARVDEIVAENYELERRTLQLVRELEKSREDVKEEETEESPKEEVETKKRKAAEGLEGLSLFGQLLSLLEAVDRSRSRIEAFENSLRSLVNTLLEWQRRARELFHWDDKEKRMEGYEKPSLEAVRRYVEELEADPVLKGFANRVFLMQVGFISGAIGAEEAAKEWQVELGDLLAKKEEADSEAHFSLAALRKMMTQLEGFDVAVPVDVEFTRAAAEADQWYSFYLSRRSRKKKISLQSAEEVIRAAAIEDAQFAKCRELIAASEEWRSLSRHIAETKENWQKSMAAIVDSYTKRIIAGSPGRNNEGENGTETVEDHLRSLLAESKKLPVQGGADTWLSRELRARSDNEKLSEALTDPECTLERARQICLSVDAPSTRALKSPGSEESFTEGPAECPPELRHAAFTCDGHLLSELERAVEEAATLEGQIHRYLEHTSEVAENEDAVVDEDVNSVIELAVREAIVSGRVHPGADGVPDYAYPLPLYYPSKKHARRSKALELLSTETPSESLPYSMRILDLVPWDAPRVSRVEPPVEVEIRKRRRILATMTAEQRRTEKETLMRRLQNPKPTVSDCIALLAWSRRLRLKVPDVKKINKVLVYTMRSVRAILRRFKVLRPSSVKGASSADCEPWETRLNMEVQPGVVEGAAADDDEQTKPLVMVTVDDLLEVLLKIDRLPLALVIEYRVVTIIEAAFDWRVRAQCLVHNLGLDRTRPRPWVGDRRTLEYWATHNLRCTDIFEHPERVPDAPLLPRACDNPVLAPPVEDYIRNTMQMRFFYIVECCRHFSTVYTDMCEICNVVTTLYTDTDAWITCDVCDKWYHQKCAGVSPDATSFTCPTCSNGTIAAAGSDLSLQPGFAIIRQTYDESLQPPLDAFSFEERDVLARTIKQRQRIGRF